jgi:hypothetical protein
MKRLPGAVVALLASAAAVTFVFVGCGSDSVAVTDGSDAADDGANEGATGDESTTADTGVNDAFIDAILDGGRDPDATSCKPIATACTKSTECCTATCDATSGMCAAASTLCDLPGATCVTGNTCCTGSCAGGTCSGTQCVADTLGCAVSSDCCSQDCVPDGKGGGMCKPLGTKPVSGNPCTMNAQCASGWCNNGICANPSFCTVDGDICSTDQQCCGGACTKAAGASVGTCSVVVAPGGLVGGPCKPAGELCSPDGTCTSASCCSRSCAPSASSGLGVCQPESGCHIIGDLCRSTNDCCGVKDLPGSIKGGNGPSTDVQCQKASAGATFGICNYVSTVCSPAGSLCKPGNATVGGAMSCSTKADCCAGNDNQFPTCQIDTNGIPRCTILPNLDCTGAKPAAGTQCASSADCCGDPCLLNTDPATKATKPYVCGSTCQMQGTSCTSNADCCNGLPCALPSGSASGICGGTLLTDGGVSTTPPPGTDGGVVQPPMDGGTDAAAPICALYGQACVTNGNCCSGVPCTNGTCHYP